MGFKMTYKTKNGNMVFDAIVKNKFEAWATIATIQELFEEKQCGCCSSERIRWMVRTSAGRNNEVNTFYEIICEECSAKLEFGTNKEGTRMWPKRRDKNKNILPDRGWYVYVAPAQNSQDQTQNAPSDEQYNNQDPGYYDQAPPPVEGEHLF